MKEKKLYQVRDIENDFEVICLLSKEDINFIEHIFNLNFGGSTFKWTELSITKDFFKSYINYLENDGFEEFIEAFKPFVGTI